MSIGLLKKIKKTFFNFHLTNLLFCGIIKTMKEEAFLMFVKLLKFYNSNRWEIFSAVVLIAVFAVCACVASAVLG